MSFPSFPQNLEYKSSFSSQPTRQHDATATAKSLQSCLTLCDPTDNTMRPQQISLITLLSSLPLFQAQGKPQSHCIFQSFRVADSFSIPISGQRTPWKDHLCQIDFVSISTFISILYLVLCPGVLVYTDYIHRNTCFLLIKYVQLGALKREFKQSHSIYSSGPLLKGCLKLAMIFDQSSRLLSRKSFP